MKYRSFVTCTRALAVVSASAALSSLLLAGCLTLFFVLGPGSHIGHDPEAATRTAAKELLQYKPETEVCTERALAVSLSTNSSKPESPPNSIAVGKALAERVVSPRRALGLTLGIDSGGPRSLSKPLTNWEDSKGLHPADTVFTDRDAAPPPGESPNDLESAEGAEADNAAASELECTGIKRSDEDEALLHGRVQLERMLADRPRMACLP